MKTLIPRALSVVALILAAQGATAQTPAPAPATPAQAPAPVPPKRLEPGDPAPALDIADWVKGPEVKAFEKGKCYVVEFWATWCAPCVRNIPHLTALQARYPERNVTVIGVSTDQGPEALKTVKAMVDKRGAGIGYSIALDAGGTGQRYLQAVMAPGIPYAFVIDKEGKVVWFGFPNQVSEGMEMVIREVAAGTFDVTKHKERMKNFVELDQKFAKAMQDQKWEEAEKLLDQIVAVRPDLAGTLAGTRFGVIASSRNDVPAAMSFARKAFNADLKADPEALVNFANIVVGTKGLKPEDQAFATQVAQGAVDATRSKDSQALVILSFALEREGKMEDAVKAAQAASDAAEVPIEKRYYDDRVQELKAKKAEADRSGAKPTDPAKP